VRRVQGLAGRRGSSGYPANSRPVPGDLAATAALRLAAPRRTWPSWGSAAGGVSGEDRSAWSGFGAPGLPFRRLPGFPLLSARATHFDAARSSPGLARPFRAVSRGLAADSSLALPPVRAGRKHATEVDDPRELLGPFSASGTGDPLLAGAATHPPRSDLGVSHALAGLRPPGPLRACFIPVTLLGFRTFRGLFLPESRAPLEASSPPVPFRRLRRFALPGNPRRREAAVPLLVFPL
jgi:hypothetical protein